MASAVAASRTAVSPMLDGTVQSGVTPTGVSEYEMQWTEVAYGVAPCSRYSHQCGVIGGNTMVVVGGADGTDGGPALDDKLHQFKVDPSPSWINDDPLLAASGHKPLAMPLRLSQHAVCSDETHVYVVGGWESKTRRRNHDVVVVSEGGVEIRKYGGEGPGGVTFSAAALCRGSVYVFGGCTNVLENKLWHLDLAGSWSVSGGGTPPSRRSSHTMVCVGDRLFVYGGLSDRSVPLGDFHCYEAPIASWIPFESANVPSPRYGHAMASVPNSSKIFMHGGIGPSGKALDDLHMLDLAPLVSGASTFQWVPIQSSVAPSPRAYHSLVILSGTLCLFGGKRPLPPSKPAANNQLWMLEILFDDTKEDIEVEEQSCTDEETFEGDDTDG